MSAAPPRISWPIVVLLFFHSCASNEPIQEFYLDYLERKVTGGRERWKYAILVDAMLCLVHGKTRSYPNISEHRSYCHHTAFHQAVMLAMEISVKSQSTDVSIKDLITAAMAASNSDMETDDDTSGSKYTAFDSNHWLRGLVHEVDEETTKTLRKPVDYSKEYKEHAPSSSSGSSSVATTAC